MRRSSVFSLRSTVAIGLFATLMYECVATAQQPTAWDGIYTAQQAERGRTAYTQSCAACHAEDLRGRATAPSLVEESFAFLYNDVSVGELLDKIQKLMPSDRPGSLPTEAYRDIVAFLLLANKFPAGEKEMEADPEVLRKVMITTKR
jgi:S-disulfanyl-L-cysteine oxidoreductase SoxD